MSTFSDYFSNSAALYAFYRPHYPAALFEWLAKQAPAHRRAWDCGTGSGQAATQLAKHFDHVIATDPSHSQLLHAQRVDHVHYGVMTAEQSALRDSSVQLVTVAQALHWFNLEHFYHEVERVLVPGGVIGVWSYGLLTISPVIDARINSFYREEVGAYWPAERALVEAGYAQLEFPFREVSAPAFTMEASWTLEQFAGFLSSWSAVTRFQKAHGYSPVDPFVESVEPLWGPGSTRRVTWPLEFRVGTI